MILKIATIILLQVSMINVIGKLSSSKMLHKKEFVITTVIFSILYSCLDGIFEKGIITIFSMIYLALTSKIFLKLNNKDLIFYVVITWILGVVIDIMTMLIMSLWHITEHINEENNSIFQSICTAVMILIYLLCAKSKFVNKTINKLKKLKNRINSFYYKLIAIIAIYFILGLICFNNMGNKEIPIIVLVIAISLLLILIIFIIQQFQINSLQENIILLTKNNEFYIEFIDKYRILKHNLISNLNSIKSVANEDTKTLINDLIRKYNKELKLPTNFKELPTGVNGIVYEKIYSHNIKNLDFSISNKIKNNIIEVLTPRDYNLFCEALGVTLDNALDALKESKEKILLLEFKEDENSLSLKIVNTFTGEIDIEKLGTKNYTSKKKGNGIGLFSILNNKRIKLITSIKSNKYSSIIMVNKK